ncbi:hypothetical protein [Aerococcus sp. L_32]|uniref:hypothetical protein n=1 Tax=Aerococcus sp. L_32 TaxID=3422316 RepID=UPI003D6BF0B3
MNVYKVLPNYYDRDMTNAIIVVARNKNTALEIAKKGNPFDVRIPLEYQNRVIWWKYEKEQYPLIVEEVDLTTPHVVLAEWIE